MGTRNLTAVMIDGEYKIAQYGQWDGYPSGQGITVLNFLRETNINKFKQNCRKTRFLTKKETEEIDEKYKTKWKKHFPQLSRNHGAKILEMVYKGESILKNHIGFAGNSLFCEYAYIVDFDLNTFEVYKGFNQEVVKEGRFKSGDSSLEKEDGFEPIKIIKSYNLDNLPTEKEFLEYFEDDEDD